MPQNRDSGSDDSKPQQEGHSANSMRVETMASERHICRATPRLVKREREKTVKHDHHTHYEQRSSRQEANELHRADVTALPTPRTAACASVFGCHLRNHDAMETGTPLGRL